MKKIRVERVILQLVRTREIKEWTEFFGFYRQTVLIFFFFSVFHTLIFITNYTNIGIEGRLVAYKVKESLDNIIKL